MLMEGACSHVDGAVVKDEEGRHRHQERKESVRKFVPYRRHRHQEENGNRQCDCRVHLGMRSLKRHAEVDPNHDHDEARIVRNGNPPAEEEQRRSVFMSDGDRNFLLYSRR